MQFRGSRKKGTYESLGSGHVGDRKESVACS